MKQMRRKIPGQIALNFDLITPLSSSERGGIRFQLVDSGVKTPFK